MQTMFKIENQQLGYILSV